jgi:hypothetical protein
MAFFAAPALSISQKFKSHKALGLREKPAQI